MADDYYIPGMPKNLEWLIPAPDVGAAGVKALRQKHAGNPAMQQKLAIADRYHQGKGMAEDSVAGALASLAGSVPYDAAKLAYFNGPAPVKKLLGNISERLFPGEGFNDRTTARPDVRQYLAMRNGIAEGVYGRARQAVGGIAEASDRLPLPVLDGLSNITRGMNQQLGMPLGTPALAGYASAGVRGVNNVVQTLVPYADNRPYELPPMVQERPPPMSPADMKKLDDIVRGWKLPPAPPNAKASLK